MYLKQTGFGDVKFIQLAQDRVQWRAEPSCSMEGEEFLGQQI